MIVLFDGTCRLCNAWVRFVIARDPGGRIRFAPLDSSVARSLLSVAPGAPVPSGSVVVIHRGQAFMKSAAVLLLLANLSPAWRVLGELLKLAPRRCRDLVYDWVARHRYRWFGREACRLVPTAALRERFLDENAIL